MMRLTTTATIAALFILTACASITKGSDEKITVTTTPPNAACSLKNDAGQWSIEQTPGSAIVQRDYSDLVIRCNGAAGSASTTLEPQTRARAYGNILLGGVPALYDAHTGAGYDYQPEQVELTLGR